jgi:hypothetical protein
MATTGSAKRPRQRSHPSSQQLANARLRVCPFPSFLFWSLYLEKQRIRENREEEEEKDKRTAGRIKNNLGTRAIIHDKLVRAADCWRQQMQGKFPSITLVQLGAILRDHTFTSSVSWLFLGGSRVQAREVVSQSATPINTLAPLPAIRTTLSASHLASVIAVVSGLGTLGNHHVYFDTL